MFGQLSSIILEMENKFQQNNTFKIFETIKASILGVPRLGSVVLLLAKPPGGAAAKAWVRLPLL